MDKKTEQILQIINFHLKLKNIITILCYFLIVGGVFTYVFYAFNKAKTIKLINDYKNNVEEYKTEKIMTNPKINLQYDGKDVYHIQAKKAFHEDEQEITLEDVFATGDIGNITAGKLEISESGDHLIFTKNPVLILNKTKNEQ